jgi:hypothetical protein
MSRGALVPANENMLLELGHGNNVQDAMKFASPGMQLLMPASI